MSHEEGDPRTVVTFTSRRSSSQKISKAGVGYWQFTNGVMHLQGEEAEEFQALLDSKPALGTMVFVIDRDAAMQVALKHKEDYKRQHMGITGSTTSADIQKIAHARLEQRDEDLLAQGVKPEDLISEEIKEADLMLTHRENAPSSIESTQAEDPQQAQKLVLANLGK